jgi:hypothetical protein
MEIRIVIRSALSLKTDACRRVRICGRLALASLLALTAFGQVRVPEGTKLRVRLEQSISSATAEEGQVVELAVADAVKIGNAVVFPEGARVIGTITEAQEKRRMGRAGKLDFSIDRVKAADDQWIPVRYTLNKKSGESHGVRTGVLTAGAAVVFWPAAPFFLLMTGKDITINKGVTLEVFTDTDHYVGAAPPTVAAASASAPASIQATEPNRLAGSAFAAGTGVATVSVTSSVAAAEIEVDGAFVGDTPTTLQLPAGSHRVLVKCGAKLWDRTLQVNSGSTISLNATFQ